MFHLGLTRELRRLGLRMRRPVADLLGGEYRSVFRGRGLLFEEVRPYEPGDEVRAIDWNVTARMGQPFVKRFAEERELSVVLAVDCSASQRFGTGPGRKREVAGELAALLAFAAIRNDDRVGLAAFTDQVERFLPPRKGIKHGVRLVRDALYYRPAKRGTSIRNCLEFLERVVRRRSILAIFSDFLDSDFEHTLRRAAKRHDVIAFRIADPAERRPLPEGRYWFEDAESGSQIEARGAAGFGNMASQLDVRDRTPALCVDLVDISTDGHHLDAMLRFFRRRSQGIRR